jgi:hypothetical protein
VESLRYPLRQADYSDGCLLDASGGIEEHEVARTGGRIAEEGREPSRVFGFAAGDEDRLARDAPAEVVPRDLAGPGIDLQGAVEGGGTGYASRRQSVSVGATALALSTCDKCSPASS